MNPHIQKLKTLDEKFWEKVDKSEDCWEWTAYKDSLGYGKFAVNRTAKLSHRIAWELLIGDIPDGMCVLHHCDNPPCCNPKHLFIGTRGDNNRDRDNKGRSNGGSMPGETNPVAKVTANDVRVIRRLYEDGNTYAAIAKSYPIYWGTVRDIVKRRSWQHVA